ncbi:MAG: GtrA family protein [Pedobacter sp.]|nr:MAG: GtrA family protein [Pedobacter sp.]
MRKAILRFIDFFYPPFSRWITPHTFRYIVSGGTTACTGVVVYFIAYNFILQQQDVRIDGMPLITGPIAALAIESIVTFLIGFMLNKYLVFTQSNLKGRVQLFRYGSVVATNVLLNYAFLKVLVEAFSFYPTVAKLISSLILAVFSYFSQKYFSFKVKN